MRKFSYFIILVLTLGDIFLFRLSSDFRIFGILLVYLLLVKALKFNSKISFLFSLVFLLLAYCSFMFGDINYFTNPDPNIPISEKATVWAFLFIVVGIMQQLKESFKLGEYRKKLRK